MPQDYNVDDILEEIRRKKSSGTPSSDAPRRNTYTPEQESADSPKKSVREARRPGPVRPIPVRQRAASGKPEGTARQDSENIERGIYADVQPLGSRRSRPNPQQTAGLGATRAARNAAAPRTPSPRPERAGFAFRVEPEETRPRQNSDAQPSVHTDFSSFENAYPGGEPQTKIHRQQPSDSFSFDPPGADSQIDAPEEWALPDFGDQVPSANSFSEEPDSFDFTYQEDRLPPQTATPRRRLQEDSSRSSFNLPEEFEPFGQDKLETDVWEEDPYTSPEDREEALKEVRSARVGMSVKLFLTGVFAFISLYLGFSLQPYSLFEKLGFPNGLLFLPPFMLPEQNMRMFLIGNLIICVLAGIVCSDCLARGIVSFCKMQANTDSPAAIAFLGVLVQGLVLTIYPDAITENPSVSLYFPVAVLLLFFSAAGARMRARRIERNFSVVSDEEQPQYAFLQIEDRELAREFSRGLGPDADNVAYSVESSFFRGFFTPYRTPDYCDGFTRMVSPICFAGALVVGIVTFLLAKDPVTAVSAATAVLCVCAPFSGVIIQNQMLSKMSKRLARKGTAISGYDTAEELSETGAVVLSDRDLFFEENVMLHGMKVFAEKRIDEAILDAASVILSCNGVMSSVFLNMIGGNRRMLKKVDNLIYEDNLGISAWVDGKRVLIGNQELMRHHEIECPSRDFESRYTRDGRRVLYLSNSGELAAMFVVSYNADPGTSEILHSLERHGVFASVYTSDPNVTSELVALSYGLKKSSIRILPAKIHAEYRELIRPRESVPFYGIHTGGLAGMQQLLKAACAIRHSAARSTVTQLIGTIVGYGLVAFMAFSGSLSSAPFHTLILFQLGWLIVNCLSASIIKW